MFSVGHDTGVDAWFVWPVDASVSFRPTDKTPDQWRNTVKAIHKNKEADVRVKSDGVYADGEKTDATVTDFLVCVAKSVLREIYKTGRKVGLPEVVLMILDLEKDPEGIFTEDASEDFLLKVRAELIGHIAMLDVCRGLETQNRMVN